MSSTVDTLCQFVPWQFSVDDGKDDFWDLGVIGFCYVFD